MWKSGIKCLLCISVLLSFAHALLPVPLAADSDDRSGSTEFTMEGTKDSTAGTSPQEITVFQLDEIMVQGERDKAFPEDTSLLKIDREDVAAPLSRSVADALAQDSDVSTFRNSRGEQGFTLRGFDQRQLLVLLDGVPLYSAYDRTLDLGKIPLGPMAHITIAKGASSVAYGPNGLGGAINITTRKPGTGPLLEGEFASSPEDDAYRLRVGSDGRSKLLAYHVDVGGVIEDRYHLSDRFDPTRNEDGGRRENSDTEDFYVSGKATWEASAAHQFQTGALYLRGHWGVPPDVFTLNPHFWRWSLWENLNGHVGHAGRYGAFWMEESLYINRNTTELDSFDDSSYSTQDTDKAFFSRYEDTTLGITLKPAYVFSQWPFPGQGLLARAWVGARYDRHREDPSADESVKTFSVYTLTLAPEVELEYSDRLSFIAGLQTDVEIPEDVEEFHPENTSHVGPMLQALYRPAETLFLKLQATRRARFPTLKERYSDTIGGRIANPDLKPEKAWNVGLDGGYERGGVRIVAGLFYSYVTDLIEETVPIAGSRQIDNVGTARYAGAETQLEVALVKGLLARAEYAYLYWDLESPEAESLAYRPAHKGSIGLSYAWRDRVSAFTRVRVVSSQDFQDQDTAWWGRLGPYASWDAHLSVRPVQNIELWLNVDNLLDANYQTSYGFPDPGRTYWIGIRGSIG